MTYQDCLAKPVFSGGGILFIESKHCQVEVSPLISFSAVDNPLQSEIGCTYGSSDANNRTAS